MSRVEHISKLQRDIKNIRNICILAHVDHGKTTLSDCLLTTNGIISSKLSGKVRYMDNRPDEQERGITMKSSGISLYFEHLSVINGTRQSRNYLINLIDSPGHVDFSSEVSTASRLCDGALVLVDAVEGVCTQTHTVLRQARQEKLKTLLVINKLDRLVTELKLDPMEAYAHITRIIEQVNAILGNFEAQDILEKGTKLYEEGKEFSFDDEVEEENNLYFSPENGNVIFASAIDGWAFRINQFAQLYASKLNMKESLLNKVLWGDYYLDKKAKRVVTNHGLKGRQLKPMFVQFVLENLWSVYAAVLEKDVPKIENISKALGIKLTSRELNSKDTRGLLQSIMTQWLPLSSAVLMSIVQKLPNPQEAQAERVADMLPDNFIINDETEKLHKSMITCSPDGPVIAYVSKMFSISKSDLPMPKRARLTPEELKQLRENIALKSKQVDPDQYTQPIQQEDEILIGFARIYSGEISVGQEIHIFGPKYNPEAPEKHHTVATAERLFLLMGKDLEDLQSVPAGNVFGILGLEGKVLKTATISTSSSCPSLASVKMEVAPIVRVAVEPADPIKMNQLIDGLKKLNEADPCAQVIFQETGENIVACAGELHLEFARIEINASEPVVPFRETISPMPSLKQESGESDLPTGTVIEWASSKACKIQIRAVPLPPEITEYLVSNQENVSTEPDFINNLKAKFDSLESVNPKIYWQNLLQHVLSFGPKKSGPNLLVSDVSKFANAGEQDGTNFANSYLSSFTSAFQLATFAGPLCGEPMMGVCFILQDFEIDPTANLVALGGQLVSILKEQMKQAFLMWSPRLMLAMYSCELQTPTDILGRVYGVLARRKGRILSEDMKEGTPFFTVKAKMPVVESFGFADGAASPQLIFCGFELLDLDPFWVPTTEEELEDLGEKADRENQAKKYMDMVRKRKGLSVDEKIVEHAEKQKTLKSQ